MNPIKNFLLAVLIGFLLLCISSSSNFLQDFDISFITSVIAGFLIPVLLPNKHIVINRYVSHFIAFIPFLATLFIEYNYYSLYIWCYPVLGGYLIYLIWKCLPTPWLPPIFLASITGLCALFYFYWIPTWEQNHVTASVRQKVTIHSLQTMKGQPVAQQELDKKIVLLNFWYFGCLPCLEGLPLKNELFKKYKNNPNVIITTVNVMGDSVSRVQDYFRRHHYDIGVLYDSKRLFFDYLQMPSTPSAVLIDQNGFVRKRYVGGSKAAKRIVVDYISHDIDELLDEFVQKHPY